MWPSQDVGEKLHVQFENFRTAFVHTFDRVLFNEESKNNYLTVFMAVAHEILTRWRINSMEIHAVKQQ